MHFAAIVAVLVVLATTPSDASTFTGGRLAFFKPLPLDATHSSTLEHLMTMRGGATVEDDEIEFESSEEEEEEEEEDEEFDARLVKSTQSAAASAKTKAAKAAISEVIAPKKSGSSSGTFLKLLQIPYIVRACLNPLTVMKMTQGYFASLLNLNYLDDKVDSSQDLRNALTEKAKKTSPSKGGSRGKRKFKPGQAKVSFTSQPIPAQHRASL